MKLTTHRVSSAGMGKNRNVVRVIAFTGERQDPDWRLLDAANKSRVLSIPFTFLQNLHGNVTF